MQLRRLCTGLLGGGGLAVLLSSCELGCDPSVTLQILPKDLSVRVGQSVTAEFLVGGCGKRLNVTPFWSSDNPEIVAIDSLTGVLTGRSPGTAVINVRSLESPGAYRTSTSVRIVQ